MNITATFIAAASTHGTGGNCMVDVIELKSGKAICISDECVALYDSVDEFHTSGNELQWVIGDGFARADSPNGLSPMGLTFVEAITTFEPDGPVSVDLIVLCDGRVIGVDTETIVLYPSMEAFDATDGSEAYPTLALEDAAPEEPDGSPEEPDGSDDGHCTRFYPSVEGDAA